MFFVLSASVSSPTAVNTGRMILLPVEPTLSGYSYIFQYQEIWSGYLNTILYTVVGTLLNLAATLPCAYALSRKDLDGRNIIMTLFIITMYFIGGLTSDVCENPGVALSSSVASSIDTLINSKTQYPEAIIRLLDYFWSEDGATDGFGGWEGETYDLVDCAGHKMIQMRCPGGYTSGDEFRGAEAIIHTAFSYYLNAQNTQLGLPLVMSDEELDTYIDEIGWPAMMEKGLRAIDNLEKVSAYPILGYTEEEVAKRTTYVTDITSQIKSYRTKFITGELDIEKDWDSFLTSLEQMGLQELLSIEQSAYDR